MEIRYILAHIGKLEEMHVHHEVDIEVLRKEFPDFEDVITQ